jgi:hypothetical protein
MSETASGNPAGANQPGREPWRHVVLLGDVLLDAYRGIDKSPGKFEDEVLPHTSNWKLSVVSFDQIEREGLSLAVNPDATHAMIFIEGNHAIEQSGLLEGLPEPSPSALAHLSVAADEFERKLDRLIHVAQAARLVTMVCTIFLPNYRDPARQRIACAALALFNDRITKRAAQSRLALIDLRLTCNESEDYDKPTLLSKRGVQKVAGVIRYAMLELDVGTRRTEVFF